MNSIKSWTQSNPEPNQIQNPIKFWLSSWFDWVHDLIEFRVGLNSSIVALLMNLCRLRSCLSLFKLCWMSLNVSNQILTSIKSWTQSNSELNQIMNPIKSWTQSNQNPIKSWTQSNLELNPALNHTLCRSMFEVLIKIKLIFN
jgi:hypothetical protein